MKWQCTECRAFVVEKAEVGVPQRPCKYCGDTDYEQVPTKHHFNENVVALADWLEVQLADSSDPLKQSMGTAWSSWQLADRYCTQNEDELNVHQVAQAMSVLRDNDKTPWAFDVESLDDDVTYWKFNNGTL